MTPTAPNPDERAVPRPKPGELTNNDETVPAKARI